MLTLSTSCKSQEKKDEYTIGYSAQTRGYFYSLQLKNEELEINDNDELKKMKLTENQSDQILKMLSAIDFENTKNNILTEDLSVDKAIKGVFKTEFDNNIYTFEFDHNNLPENIEKLLSQLEKYFK